MVLFNGICYQIGTYKVIFFVDILCTSKYSITFDMQNKSYELNSFNFINNKLGSR